MKALVLFRGGLDSTTCLAMAVEKYKSENVTALCVFYGQKHKKEIESAEKIAEYYNVELIKLDLGKIFSFSSCSLLEGSDEDIPLESYAEQLKRGTCFNLCSVQKRSVYFFSSKYCTLKGLQCDLLWSTQ